MAKVLQKSNGSLGVIPWGYPFFMAGLNGIPGLVNIPLKLLQMGIEIVDLPIKNGWIFP